jgi:hypothetical protein
MSTATTKSLSYDPEGDAYDTNGYTGEQLSKLAAQEASRRLPAASLAKEVPAVEHQIASLIARVL